MNHVLKTSLYSILVSGVLLFIVIIYSNFIQKSHAGIPQMDVSNIVKNFEDCKSKGFQITNNNREECKTPSGIIFINMKELIAATTTETIVIHKKKTIQRKP